MSRPGPDFDELVGTDLDVSERERLLRVHEALVAAGPPPELPSRLAAPPSPEPVRLLPRRRRGALLALAAALGVAAFGIGFLVGRGGGGPSPVRVVAMAGTELAPQASASLEIFDVDTAGNWPMEISVRGLGPSASGRPYEVWLAKNDKLAAFCGSFRAEEDGTTVVPMNAPYKLNEFDGWVVVEEGSTAPLLTTT